MERNRQAHAAGVEHILTDRDQGRLHTACDEFGAPAPASASSNALDLLVGIHPGDPVVAEINGEIDIASVSWLRETLLLAIQRHRQAICVNLQGVTFLDCSGVSALIASARRARLDGGWMQVIHPSAQARRVIMLLRLQHLLKTREQAGVAAACCEHAARSAHQRSENVNGSI